ncbi:DUF6538 domain-containing protein [Kaistia terrae]|uniref:DUF6538 domain-containing protein n=1 Tax=Kaistia terrae TaxID=537017 RepID=A0ABW0PYW9_9HYPH|nr:DUF6538 domain-containing protein [Kaistia terrae]MCX5580274.1 hypothetical protein [Kaistia terrae]
MARPLRHSASGILRFKVRVPADVLPKVKGRKIDLPIGLDMISTTVGEFVEASLRTRDPAEAKARHSAALATVLRYWSAVREGPQPLTHRRAEALAGIVYRDIVAGNTDEKLTELVGETERMQSTITAADGSPDKIKTALRHFVDQAGLGIVPLLYTKAEFAKLAPSFANLTPPVDWYALLEAVFGKMADSVLTREGMIVDDDGRRLLLDSVRAAVVDANKAAVRNVYGDYSPDPKAGRFPPSEEAKPKAHAKLSVTDLIDGHLAILKAGGQGAAAEKRWRPIVAKFVAFLKHDDATRVTKSDLIAWKDYRLLVEGRSPKTVRDSDLAALRACFQWAVDNVKLPFNPVEGVKVKLAKGVRTRGKGFTDEEALNILKAANEYRRPDQEYEETAAAKRWAPWLCAFTGARIAEICQLRQEDFSERDGVPVIRINPEAGSVKSGHYRDIPLHPQLVELGLLAFVAASKAGPLFHRTKPRSAPRKGLPPSPKVNPANAVAASVGEWVNGLGVIAGKVAPNHGWRHRFKTVCIEVGIQPRIADAIQDHAARTAGEAYGDVTLKAKYEAIKTLPKYAA